MILLFVSVFYFYCKRNKIYTTGHLYMGGDSFGLVHHAIFLHKQIQDRWIFTVLDETYFQYL